REQLQKAIEQGVHVLQRGGVILYPADTIWGLGCDVTCQEAIDKIFEIKGRQRKKPFIVLVSDLDQLYEVAATVHPRIDTLLHFHERPLTVIYPKATPGYLHLSGPDGSIGVRIVKSGFCHELLCEYGKPLISTSANLAEQESPTTFGTISSHVLSKVDFAFPAFTEKDLTGRPSVIAKYDENGELDFLR
ncbi:MAG: L-threonylcarbamoyladenylate synthase, partial [Bacteroidota bacterium]|nr:L-threonylcarbamoyladenylate synthase [Bacteroidota bacterium]